MQLESIEPLNYISAPPDECEENEPAPAATRSTVPPAEKLHGQMSISSTPTDNPTMNEFLQPLPIGDNHPELILTNPGHDQTEDDMADESWSQALEVLDFHLWNSYVNDPLQPSDIQ